MTVMNYGSRTAYDVEAVVDIVYPENSSFFRLPDVPIGSVSLENDGYKLRWTIPEIEGLERVETVIVRIHPETFTGVIFDKSLDPHEYFGQVSTASFESDFRKENNTDRIWAVPNDSDGGTDRAMSDYSIQSVSVDEPSPSPGDIVNFTINAAWNFAIIDNEIAIELTDGLTIDEDAAATPPRVVSFIAPGNTIPPSYSDGLITIGTRKFGEGIRTLSATLPVRVADSAVVSEQCLTATITGNPPPGAGPFDDDITDNVAKLCLGDLPRVPFDSGDVRTWTLYACKDHIAANACDTAAEVDVRVLATIEGSDEDRALYNANALVQVKDEPGRVFDANTGSVTDGTTVSWQTASTESMDFTGTRSGVQTSIDYASVDDYIDNWTSWLPTFKASGLDGGDPPGEIHIRSDGNGTAFWFLTSGTSYTSQLGFSLPLSAPSLPLPIFLDFDELGTYVLDFVADMLHATIDDDGVTGPDMFSGTGRTIFHVGPIADLGVVDGGVSAKVEADQLAFTVAGFNNRDEEAESGRIVVELPAGTTGLTTIPPDTGTFDGNASPPTWTWDIHDLAETEPERRMSKGLPPYDPIILIVDGVSAGETATANVVYDPYEVCVDSDGTTATATDQTTCEAITGASWHSGTVYDYNRRNNTAILTARAGGNLPGAPALQTPVVYMPAVGFEWDEIQFLYGTPVKHYETEWSADGATGWHTLRADVPETTHVDTGITAGQTRYYRVRAVNQAGVPGPWSSPMSAMAGQQATAGAPDAPVLTAVPNEPNGRTEILITWSKPVENGSAITSYTLEVADRSSGPWTDVSPQPGAADERYVYSDGLTGGTRKYFRMLATNMCDGNDPNVECDSLWSAVVDVTTRAPGISGAPTNVSAVPDGDSAIDMSWVAPQDDGGTPITRYEVQWSADGVGRWNNAGSTTDVESLTFKNTGMSFGTTRYYRVAARNNRGLSAWSDPPYASATTLSGVPGQPSLTARATASDTIALTWNEPADNGDPITRYEIEWSEDGSANSWSRLTIASASDTSYDDSGLDPGTQRYYQIRAVNNTGEGSWSTARNATTPPAVPGAPTLRAEANGENAIDLTWDPPVNDGGADISGYELHVSNDGGTTYSRLTSPSASARSYTHSGLKPGDGRHYQLRARNRAGLGEFSQPVFANTLTGVPTAPGLTARANGSTEIKLSWTKPDDKGSEIHRYELEESNDGNDWNALSFNISDNDSEYVHTGLSGGTTKYYRIRAWNGNGGGQWSTTRSARTDAGGPDAPVLTLTVIDDNQIDLSWTVPADNGSSIRGYWVERSVDGNAPWERLTSSNRTTTYSDEDLYRGMTRYYRVAATNGTGTGPYSDVKSATTTGDPATAPGSPTLARLSSVGRNQVTFSWDPPAEDGGAPVSGYEYEVAAPCKDDPSHNCGFTGDDIKPTTSTSVRITGLNTEGTYYFQVRAVNPVGKGDWTRDVQAILRPSTSGQVQVNPTTITVNEGATITYTIRLSTAPPHPVQTWIQPRGLGAGGKYNDIEDAAFEYNTRVLVPNGWTHPDPDEASFWAEVAYNWNQGVRVTFTAPEDDDSDDEVALMDHYVTPLPYDHYRPCSEEETEADREKCKQAWEDAWANSPYQYLTGASVLVTVRDND